jgi:hypothetical protein
MIEIQEDDYPNEVDSQNYILSNQNNAPWNEFEQ